LWLTTSSAPPVSSALSFSSTPSIQYNPYPSPQHKLYNDEMLLKSRMFLMMPCWRAQLELNARVFRVMVFPKRVFFFTSFRLWHLFFNPFSHIHYQLSTFHIYTFCIFFPKHIFTTVVSVSCSPSIAVPRIWFAPNQSIISIDCIIRARLRTQL
jgi:hypothetical protein